jgi:TrpR-related protein YerC/YecD
MNNRKRGSDPNNELYRAILKLRTPEECYAFMEDLCTQTELKALEQRYEVANMLSAGMIYNDILAKTGASSATVSRVNRSLLNGNDAYQMIIDRMKEEK